MPIPGGIRDRVSSEISEDLKRLLPRIVKTLKPDQVILFGSNARGDVSQTSDLDLIVVAETEENFFDRIGRVLALYDGKRDLDVLVYTPQEFSKMLAEGRDFLTQAVEEGKVLYRRPGLGSNR